MITHDDALCQVSMAMDSLSDLKYHQLVLGMILDVLKSPDNLTLEKVDILIGFYAGVAEADIESIEHNLERVHSYLSFTLNQF